MKISNKVCAAVLVASFGMAAFAPAASAATEWAGKGKINFTENDTPVVTPPVTPPEGGGEIEEGDKPGELPTNPEKGPMKIVAVTDLYFGSEKADLSTAEKTFNAKPFAAKIKGETTTTDMANFVMFQDLRTDVAANHYTISAEITKQFTKGTQVLAGSTLTYKNMAITSVDHDAKKPTVSAAAVSEPVKFGESTEILVNKENAKGQGIFTLAFGSMAAGNADKSVVLTIPGSNSISKGDYTAEVTWSITDAN